MKINVQEQQKIGTRFNKDNIFLGIVDLNPGKVISMNYPDLYAEIGVSTPAANIGFKSVRH